MTWDLTLQLEIFSNMKKIAKQIINELVPNILLRPMRALKKIRLQPMVIGEDISSLKETFGLQLGIESIIIGNGPSLNYTLTNHLHFFTGKSVFCVNNFAESEYFEIIRPAFYILADPAYWSNNCSKAMTEYMNNICSQLLKKVKWQMFLLLPISAKNWNWFIQVAKENSNIILAYYNNNSNYENMKTRNMSFKKIKQFPIYKRYW